MKRQVSIAISIVIAIAFSTPSAIASGMKKAGPLVASSTTINTLLTGSVPPTSSVGKNGDVYIDVKNAVLYGPKKKGIWPLGVSLKGAEGKAGTDGKNGSDGKTGAAGTVSSTSTPGPAGPQGPKGDTGPAGPAGADGANGSAGPAGPAGQPGLNGSDGAQGIQGVQGPKGDTGASGISKGNVGEVTFSTNLTGNAGSAATSANFGNFEGGKSYLLRLNIYATDITDEARAYSLSAIAKKSDDPAPLPLYFTVTKGDAYRNMAPVVETVLHAETVVDGTGITGTFQVNVKVILGTYVSTDVIELKGFFSKVMVTEIG